MYKNIKVLVLIFAVFANYLEADAQKKAFKPFIGIGVHSGLNIGDVKIDPGIKNPEITYSAIQNSNVGLVLIFMAEEYAGIQLEVNLAKNGWKEERDSSYIYTRTMNYLEVPVLTHLSFGKKRMRYIVNLGPYISYHRNYSETLELFENHVLDSADYADSYIGRSVDSKIDLGFMFDLGIGVNTSIGIFQLKGRYSYGIINIFDKYPEGIYRFSQIRNLYFGISYHYNFHFKGKD